MRPVEFGFDFQSRSFVKNKNFVVIFRVRNENRCVGRKSFWLCASLKCNLMENRNIIAIVHTLSCGQSGVRHHFDVENVCCAFSTQNNTSLLCANKRTNRDDLVLIESRKWRLEKINYNHFNSYTHQVPDVKKKTMVMKIENSKRKKENNGTTTHNTFLNRRRWPVSLGVPWPQPIA